MSTLSGSDRTARLRKKRAKALGQWNLVLAARLELREVSKRLRDRQRKRPDHRRTPAQVRQDVTAAVAGFNAGVREQRLALEAQIAATEAVAARLA